MSMSILLSVVYILGYSPADGTAVCFGTEESGAFAPAAFEERRHAPGETGSLKGVRSLVFERSVENVGAAAFAGAPDLETVCFEGKVSSLGERAFADCPKLTCVVFASRNPVDARMDTFEGAHEQLTAVYRNEMYGKLEIAHPNAMWKNMVSVNLGSNSYLSMTFVAIPSTHLPPEAWRGPRDGGMRVMDAIRYVGPRVSTNGWMFKTDGATVFLLAYLRPRARAVELPPSIDGMPISCREYGNGSGLPEELKFDAVLADGSILGEVFGVRVRDILAKGGFIYVRGASFDAAHQMDYNNVNAVGVPEATTLADVAALTNGIPCESGYRYLLINNGSAAAVLGPENYPGRRGYVSSAPRPVEENSCPVVVPSTLGGKPVVYLPCGLFSARGEITSVEFPDTLEELPAGVCYGCSNLAKVKLPKNLKRIGRLAFYDCPKLSAPPIPDDVVCETQAFDLRPADGSRVILKP